MRVLVSCLQSTKRHQIAPYEHWRISFVQGCLEAGFKYLEAPGIDWAEGLTYSPGPELDAWRTRTWEAVLAFVRTEHARKPVDLFLGYLYPKQVEVAAIRDLQAMGIPAVNFFCDNVREFRKVPIEYRPFALHWVPEFEALPIYERANLPHIYAPMPCWVPPELRCVPEVESEPPTFIGSADILRRELFASAIQLGADFVVRGHGWIAEEHCAGSPKRFVSRRSNILLNQVATVRVHGIGAIWHKVQNRMRPVRPPPIPPSNVRDAPVGQAEYCRVTREAEVAIGVNRVPTVRTPLRRPLTYSRLRDLEAPMLGACYLTEWTEGLGTLYELGAEIETYRTPQELSEQLIELRSDSKRRRDMRYRAQLRALNDHSVACTLSRIATRLGLPATE
jgi:hypothetical protein